MTPKWIYFVFLTTLGFAMTPDEALTRLMDGNKRYMADELTHPDHLSAKREATVAQQSPYAIVVGCSDSRVPPEIIFDEGIGDLFVVRNAGNVIAPISLDSVEFAALYLGSSVILVMGHAHCGAVTAVIDNNTKDIEAVARIIEPAVAEARKAKPTDLVETAIKFNAKRMSDYIRETTVIRDLISKGKIEVRAAYYNLDSGQVELL